MANAHLRRRLISNHRLFSDGIATRALFKYFHSHYICREKDSSSRTTAFFPLSYLLDSVGRFETFGLPNQKYTVGGSRDIVGRLSNTTETSQHSDEVPGPLRNPWILYFHNSSAGTSYSWEPQASINLVNAEFCVCMRCAHFGWFKFHAI